MTKRIFAVLIVAVMLFAYAVTCFAAPAQEAQAKEPYAEITSAVYNEKEQSIDISVKNLYDHSIQVNLVLNGKDVGSIVSLSKEVQGLFAVIVEIEPGATKTASIPARIEGFNAEKMPEVDCLMSAAYMPEIITSDNYMQVAQNNGVTLGELAVENIFNMSNSSENTTAMDAIMNFVKQTGFSMLFTNWQTVVMVLIACVLLYLAIVKKFEPLLLLPIAFGMLLTNLIGAGVYHEELFAGGHVHWDMFSSGIPLANGTTEAPGLVDILYLGVKLGVYPCLIFIGVGAMTDFGPLIANPKSLLLGAAAQFGIFLTFLGVKELFPLVISNLPELLDGTVLENLAASVGIIGGADGPTAIFVTSKLAPNFLGPIAVAAYSYMALVPVIQPPIMKLLTTKKERTIVMKTLRPVSKTEKILFPIVVTIFVAWLVPSAAPLVGSLMLGNLIKESGVCERLSKTVQNELMNIVTVFLGVSVGATATASTFLSPLTLCIIAMGIVAFGVGTAGGVLLAKFMNLFLKNKINPLIGSAGVSAVPMAARVSQKVGQDENPSNFLLMHAMGPNVAGVIGSAIAAGVLLALFG